MCEHDGHVVLISIAYPYLIALGPSSGLLRAILGTIFMMWSLRYASFPLSFTWLCLTEQWADICGELHSNQVYSKSPILEARRNGQSRIARVTLPVCDSMRAMRLDTRVRPCRGPTAMQDVYHSSLPGRHGRTVGASFVFVLGHLPAPRCMLYSFSSGLVLRRSAS